MDNRGLRARLESQADGSATEAERLAEVQQENSELMAAVSRKTTLLNCGHCEFAPRKTLRKHDDDIFAPQMRKLPSEGLE